MPHTKYDTYTNDELIRFVDQGNRDPELLVELAKRLDAAQEEAREAMDRADYADEEVEDLRGRLESAEAEIAALNDGE